MANGLEEHPFFKTAPEPEKKSAPIEERLNREIPAPPTWQDTAKDVGRSIVSEGAKGLVGAGIGGVGSIESFLAKDLPEMARSAGAYIGEKADIISPERRREITSSPLYSDQEVERGYKSPFLGWPTYKGTTETFKPMLEGVKESPTAPQGAKDVAGALTYEPRTGPGKVAGAGAEMAAQGVPGALRTLPGRLMTGAGAGAMGEAFAQANEGKEGEGYARLVGTLSGAGLGAYSANLAGKLFQGLKSAVAPGAVGMDQLMEAVSTDIRRGQSALTAGQIKDMMDRGVDVTFLDLAGPETRKLIGKMATRTPGLEDQVRAYNEQLAKRAGESSQRVSSELQRMYGQPIDAAKLTDLIEEAGKRTRDELYKKLNTKDIMVDHTEFGNLLERPTMKKAMREAEETRKDFPQYEIQPPSRTPAKPSEPTNVYGPNGEVLMSKAVPAVEKPGNLAYWDEVKRKLDDVLKTAKPGTTEYNAAAAAKGDLLKHLDKIKGYAETRGGSFETFKAASAPEAGYNFFNMTDSFRSSDLKKTFNSLSDAQKEFFSVGFANKLDELIKGGNIDTVARKFRDGNFRERAQIALGPDRFAELNGLVLSEALASKVRQIPFIQEAHLPPGATSALGAGAGAALEALLSGGIGLTPKAAGMVAAGAGAARAGQVLFSSIERKIAEKVVPLALSNDPAQIKKLGEMAAKFPEVGDLLGKLTTAATTIATQAEKPTKQPEQKPQEAYGGRIGRKSGGRISHHYEAARLVKAAELAKKNFGKQTETILNAPDEHVVKALSVANRSIEG